MKVSEAGPGYLRANPIHVREALQRLEGSGDAVSEQPPSPPGFGFPTFYSPSTFSLATPADARRREEVLSLYRVFLEAVREDAGKTLERAVYRAALEARGEGHYLAVIGSPERPPDAGVVLDNVPIEGALDLILIARDGRLAVEDKNLREWLGPSSEEVWALIGKALRHDALPVLICRKVTYDLFLLFKQIGGLAFQMHGQLLPDGFRARLARVKHKDGLGFHDIRFGDDPPPALLNFLKVTVPNNLVPKIALFRENAALLREYAIQAGLERDDLPGGRRRALYHDFFRELKGWDDAHPEW